ncbi:FecR family protein [Hymenobacter daeguensis]
MTPFYADPPDAPWELLARHLAAEASPAERTALREWVQADPTHLQILTTVTRAWERAGEAAAAPVLFSPADVEAAWQRFRPLIAPAEVAPPPVPAELKRAEAMPASPARPAARPLWPMQRRQRRRWQLAAGLVLLFGAGYWLRGLFSQKPETVLTYASAARRQVVRLPDGSTVWLNAHSRLRYAWAGPKARAGLRNVQLTGEAYFEVAHNPARPFVVHTTTARVRVTGTAFNVRAFAAEDSVEVSVTHGRVWLVRQAAPDSILLTANTRAALHATDAPGRVAHQLHRTPAEGGNFRAWQTDTLHFEEASVAQVVRTLRVTFGTTVELSSPQLGQCRFTGTFARPQPGQVLAVLAATTASQLMPDGRGGYLLQGAGCAAPAPASADASAAGPVQRTPRP